MSNFEHRITEDSTDFEKAFLKIYDGSLWNTLDKMKDWQPPKPLVEVPQIVADYIETQKYNNYNGNASLIVKHYDSFKDEGNDSELNIWIANNFNDFLNAIVNGYTVKKEQLYHVVLPEVLNRYLNFRINNGDAMFGSSEEIGNYKTKFTEQEIKDIDPRYWEFAVKVEG